METQTISTVDELGVFSEELLTRWRKETADTGALVVALHGDLGAGKTTFVQTVAKALGVIDTVTSPTFVVMKSYETTDSIFSTLVHIDAYRIEDSDEMRPLYFDQIVLTPNTLVCVEWAEKIAAKLPEQAYHITFIHQHEDERTLTYGFKK